MKDDTRYRLSRRKMLGGLGAIGLASAGAGLGTSAYFNDTESFTNNSLTAGQLDLTVDYEFVGSDSFHAGDLPSAGTLDGDSLSLVVDDVKPGDWAAICLTLHVEDNPSYVRILGDLTEDAENSVTEPEQYQSMVGETNMENNVQGGSFAPGDGELAEEIVVTVGDGYSDTDPNDDQPGTISNPEPGIAASSSLRDVLAALSDPGMILRGPDGHGDSAADATAVGDPALGADVNDVEYCFLFELPASVGNWVQTDSVAFDLTFEAVQTRHIDANDPFNTTSP